MSDQYKSLLAAINDVLYNDWAPIGFIGALPHDEYESYAMQIISMLASDASEAEIAHYLATTGTSMAGSPLSPSSIMPVAHKLVAFSEAVHAIKTSNSSFKRDALKRAP